jgi:hypothetical protein
MLRSKSFGRRRNGKPVRSDGNSKAVRPNKAEAMFDDQADAAGFKIYKDGWPDRIIYDKIGNRAFFVEIKDTHTKDYLRPNQRAMHKMLKSLGLDVIVIQFNPTKKDAGLRLRKRLYKLLTESVIDVEK